VLIVFACCGIGGGCAVPFGPGYTVEKQNIEVHFEPGPPPHIAIRTEYQLKNTGTRELSLLELRLPARRRFNSENVTIEWDGKALEATPSAQNARETVLNLPHAWAVADSHSLRVTMDLQGAAGAEQHFSFAPDAFFLPAQGWAPELLPSQGTFGTGGAPPLKWNLIVQVPKDFVVHTSGDKIKNSRHGEQLTVRATQRVADIYPFVVAGRYVTKQIGSDREKIHLWTRQAQDAGDLRAVSDSLVKTLEGYNAMFGGRAVAQPPRGFFSFRKNSTGKNETPLWLVECPVMPGCFGDRTTRSAKMLGADDENIPGEMISVDSAVIDPKPGIKKMFSAAAPALAASWLGYGQSPGFYEQDPPLSAFPAFAAAIGNDALNGPTARTETIRRALAQVPQYSSKVKTDDAAVRAKSFLFFYGLEDRYGQAIFRKAIRHMLDARRSSGFNLDDLIAAFDQEANGNTAEFVRLWMKHPGVPADFRAKYVNTSADQNTLPKETTP
jgi:hypothetical protein